MIVTVSHTLIAAGRPNNCYSCPVALAILATLRAIRPDVKPQIKVTHSNVELHSGGDYVRRSLPGEARKFICNVDAAFPEYEKIKPFSFVLDDLTENEWKRLAA